MPRRGLDHERASPQARAMVVCFSLALVVMAGWFVMTVLFARDAPPPAEDPGAIPPIATRAPPRVEDTAPAVSSQLATVGLPLQSSASPWPDGRPAASSGRVASSGPSVPAAPVGAGYATSSVAPDAAARGEERAVDTGFDPGEAIPLPQPRPRRISVPVPRPRPRVEDRAEAEPQQRTLIDVLLGR